MRPGDVVAPKRFIHLQHDEREYPIIATVERDQNKVYFGAINDRRKLALAAFDWCGVCGMPFGEEPRWQVNPFVGQVDFGKGAHTFDEAPVHEICLVYAAQVCPHLSSPTAQYSDEIRAGTRRQAVVHAVGFKRTIGLRPMASHLQPGVWVLGFVHAGKVGEFTYQLPDDLRERYAMLLAREEPLRPGAPERRLIELFNDRSDLGAAVTGAAITLGAAFVPNIYKVHGLDFYSAHAYQKFAARLLSRAGAEELLASDYQDVAIRAGAQWLLDRWGRLPDLLVAWRRQARAKGFAVN